MDENGLTRKDRRLLKIKQKQMDRKSEGNGEPAFNIKAGHEMLTLKVSTHTVFKLHSATYERWCLMLIFYLTLLR